MAERKTAFVIGATKGIGRAIAIRLANDGFDIIATGRDADALESLKKTIKQHDAGFHGLVFDITDRAKALEILTSVFGDSAPDVIVYNAGITRDNLFAFMDPEEWDAVIDTNLTGFYNCVQPLIINMMGRKKGRIIVISSASGQTGQPGQVNYSASKAALIGAVKALAREVGRKGILVNAVAPGFIDTAMTEDIPRDKILSLIPLNRPGAVEEVASVVSFLCGNDSTYVHGQIIGVNGGLVI